jgi:hypothetical protein
MLVSCASISDSKSGRILEPSILNALPDAYDGKRVTVRGHLAFGNEARYMVNDAGTLENWTGEMAKYLRIANLDRLWSRREALVRKGVELSGMYRKDVTAGTVMLGACNISGVRLDPVANPRVVRQPQ